MSGINISPSPELLERYEALKQKLSECGKLAVAFSSGVDSTFLLFAARKALGDGVIAFTASSPAFPGRELRESEDFCRQYGIEQVIFESREMEMEEFRQNPKNRCYICKKELFSQLISLAGERGITHVAEGSNLDDEGDYRPGLRAIKELGVMSPLRECGFTKRDIRALSGHFGLPTSEKQSFACLASRFVYGETITDRKLRMVEQAEQLLLDMGFSQERVRIHGDMARIEVMPEEFGKLMEPANRERIVAVLRGLGFSYVTMDLTGYRTGSMNEGLFAGS